MKKKITCMALLITSALYQTTVFSSSTEKENSLDDRQNIQAQWSTPNSIYIALSAGGAFSTDASLVVPPVFWDPSPEGYNNNVGDSEVLGASIGYVLSPLFRVELGADHRNSFEYNKFLSTPTSTTWGPRTRKFHLSNTTVMGSLFINGSGINRAYQGNGFIIDPFFGAGLGSAFNVLDNMHSTQTIGNRDFSIMSAANTTRSFAYQFSVGFDVKTSRKLALGVGYRYLNAGHFSSNNYIVDNPDNISLTSGVTVPAWTGILRTNEVYVTLKYAIA